MRVGVGIQPLSIGNEGHISFGMIKVCLRLLMKIYVMMVERKVI